MDRRKTAAALAFAGLCGHAFFLPVSIAGMQIALAVAAAGVLLDPPRPLRTALDRPALAFVLVAVASDLFSPVGAPPLIEATLWRSLLGFFVVAHGLRLLSRRAAKTGPAAWLIACAAVGLLAASLVGLVQYKTGVDPVHLLGLREEPALVQAPGVPGRYGAMGFFTSRLTFGHNAVVLLCLLAGATVSRAFPRKLLPLVAAASLAALAAVAVTFDRAAYLALGVAAVALVVRSRRPRLGALLAGLGAAALLHPGVRARLLTAFSGAANSDRVFIWARAREIIADHPFRGIGFANYPHVCGAYYDRVDPHFYMRTWAHNLELSTLAELGPLGLLALFWLLFAAFRLGLRSASPYALGGLAALCAWLTIAQFHDVVYDTKVMYALWFALALGQAGSPGSPPARAG
ncbi:MAG TPA: O-antigen ligase family protein [Myxococcales bacterium]|nr:O-antigen ligase family protein [Myxococcales bacterium]